MYLDNLFIWGHGEKGSRRPCKAKFPVRVRMAPRVENPAKILFDFFSNLDDNGIH